MALLVCTEYLLLKLMEAGRRMGEYVDGVQSTSSVLEVSSYCTYMEGRRTNTIAFGGRRDPIEVRLVRQYSHGTWDTST